MTFVFLKFQKSLSVFFWILPLPQSLFLSLWNSSYWVSRGFSFYSSCLSFSFIFSTALSHCCMQNNLIRLDFMKPLVNHVYTLTQTWVLRFLILETIFFIPRSSACPFQICLGCVCFFFIVSIPSLTSFIISNICFDICSNSN